MPEALSAPRRFGARARAPVGGGPRWGAHAVTRPAGRRGAEQGARPRSSFISFRAASSSWRSLAITNRRRVVSHERLGVLAENRRDADPLFRLQPAAKHSGSEGLSESTAHLGTADRRTCVAPKDGL